MLNNVPLTETQRTKPCEDTFSFDHCNCPRDAFGHYFQLTESKKSRSFIFPLNKDDRNDFVVNCCWLHWTAADAHGQEVDCRFQKIC